MQTKSFTTEQLQAIECIEQNLLITAGAGAGKTRVLVERYLNILQSKQIKANEILAITFTEKAGKEMTERVYQELTNRLMAPNGDKLFWQKKLQELSGLKERAFRTFKKELQEKDYIKIEGGIIYVNPLFAMATDMDYIREDLINKFPKYKDVFKKINDDLLN